MKIVDQLRIVIDTIVSNRRSGRTFAIVGAAREIDATVICSHEMSAKQMRDDFKIKTSTISRDVLGTKGPYLYDHHAVESLALSALQEIESLNKKIQNLHGEVENLTRKSYYLAEKLDDKNRAEIELKAKIACYADLINEAVK